MKKIRTDEQRQRDGARVKLYYLANRQAILARLKANYHKNPQPRIDRAASDYEQLRREFVEAYGGRCACCGESEMAFLCLDHIGGGGAKDRATTGGKNVGVVRRLRREGWPKVGYRILCANCNTATSRGRTCPHDKAKLYA